MWSSNQRPRTGHNQWAHCGEKRTLRDSISLPQLVFLPRAEIGGNAVAASLSNLYYSPADRTVTGTLTRLGSQVLWNCLSNELKEFWPDIRRKLASRV